ncbi:MAG: hypothetical protein ACRD8W_05495 [Nitrososphaeraceae archaeon]
MDSNEAQIIAQSYYERVQFFNQVAGNQAAWIAILSNLFHENNPFPNDQLENKECQTFYHKYSMENVAWTISLVLMSWALRNFQRKIEDGHCRNTTHEHGAAEPRNCKIGRQFHREMLNKCLQSYRDMINTFEPT